MLLTQKEREERIFAAIDRVVSNLLYWDRKEDPDLPLGVIEAAILESNPGPAIMAGYFEKQIRERVPFPKEETVIEGEVVDE